MSDDRKCLYFLRPLYWWWWSSKQWNLMLIIITRKEQKNRRTMRSNDWYIKKERRIWNRSKEHNPVLYVWYILTLMSSNLTFPSCLLTASSFDSGITFLFNIIPCCVLFTFFLHFLTCSSSLDFLLFHYQLSFMCSASDSGLFPVFSSSRFELLYVLSNESWGRLYV